MLMHDARGSKKPSELRQAQGQHPRGSWVAALRRRSCLWCLVQLGEAESGYSNLLIMPSKPFAPWVVHGADPDQT